MGIGLAQSYESILLFRLAIGAIGASFVVTQYHTSMMFAPNCVGTANATTAGWGNLGGGVTQMVMPLFFSAFLLFGVDKFMSWRLAMIIPGAVLLLTGLAYYRFTQDAPDGNYSDLRAQGKMPLRSDKSHGSFLAAAKDYRVWALFVIYAACFGIELTINNIAALYFHDRFNLPIGTAGLIAGLFGLMNIFARTLGGVYSDRFAKSHGLKGRVWFLGIVLLLEGLALIIFSRMPVLGIAVMAMIVFSLFVQMSEGATYGIVPFINKRAVGPVAGIVGAGGNAGAVAAGFLFRLESLATQDALLLLGILVAAAAGLSLWVRFTPEVEAEEQAAFVAALKQRGPVAAI
jgi:NNP family nitrate/nitrite transporter-like MFS transporter